MVKEFPRFVSLLTKSTVALILAEGRGSRLKSPTDWRAKPTVPFGGKFRINDFPLSNTSTPAYAGSASSPSTSRTA